MFNRVLVTDGGPHAAQDWARVTCEDLVPLDGLPANLQSDGMILRGRLIELLRDHYAEIQQAERATLNGATEETAAEVFDAELEGHPDFGHLFAEIQAAALNTPWAGHITGPAVIDAIQGVVTEHIRHMRHVERLWHADRNAHLEAGQRYRERHGLPPSPAPAGGVIALPGPATPETPDAPQTGA